MEPRYNELLRDWQNVFVMTGPIINKILFNMTNLWRNNQNFVLSGFGSNLNSASILNGVMLHHSERRSR